MNFGVAACAKVHLYVHRGSFGCQLTLHVLQHLLQTCFILNDQPIPLWKGKIQQKMAKKKSGTITTAIYFLFKEQIYLQADNRLLSLG